MRYGFYSYQLYHPDGRSVIVYDVDEEDFSFIEDQIEFEWGEL